MRINQFNFKPNIQTFDDSGQRDLARIFEYSKDKIKVLMSKGAGIYWTINPQRDPNKRSIENTTELKVIGLDCDIAKEGQRVNREALKFELFEKLVNLPLPPSGMIETKNGFQPYWYFEEGHKFEDANQANEVYQQLIKSFAHHTGIKSEGDNIARVLRLPGTYHQKNPQDKFKIREMFEEGKSTSFTDFVKTYPIIEKSRRRDSLSLQNDNYEQLASLYSWDVTRGMTESESRYWNGKEYTGRDSLLVAIALSILNHEEKHNYDPEDILMYVNSLMDEPLQDRVVLAKLRSARNAPPKLSHQSDNLSRQRDNVIKPKSAKELIDQRLKERESEKEAPKTGFPELDKLIKGFIPKHLITLSGDTNTGKSSLACNFAERLAGQGKKTLYIALEPDSTVLDFLATIVTKKSFDHLTKEDYEKIPDGIDIFTNEIQTFDALKESVQANSDKYDLIIIDHIGYFVEAPENYIQRQSQLLKELALFANESNTCMMIIAHLRKPDKGSNKQPTINDIAGSAAFKQDSDEVLILIRTLDDSDKYGVKYSNTGGIVVAKTKSTGGNGYCPIVYREKTAYITTDQEQDLMSQVDYLESKYPKELGGESSE